MPALMTPALIEPTMKEPTEAPTMEPIVNAHKVSAEDSADLPPGTTMPRHEE
jgi:hypothetical protein